MKLQTTKLKRIFKASALLIAVSVLAVGCNEKHAEYPPVNPTPGEATYEINGTVTKSGTTSPLSGVTVTYSNNAKSGSTTTNSSGYFEFKGLKDYGTYTITFELDGYSTNYQTIQFTQGNSGENKIQSVNISLAQLPENSTNVDPEEGGEVPIYGNMSGELVILPNTTVKNANGAQVTGPIGFYANEVNDIQTSDVMGYAPLAVVDLLPNGYTFSSSAELRVDNPLTSYYFGNTILQYYNPSTGAWVTQTQGVNYKDEQYVTTLPHFSIYKIAINAGITSSTSEVSIEVEEPIIDNVNSIEPKEVETAQVMKYVGYKYETTIDQALTQAGITTETSEITEQIQNVIKKHLNNTADATDDFETVLTRVSVNQTVQGGYTMHITAKQEVRTINYTFNIMAVGGSSHNVNIIVQVPSNTITVATTVTEGNDHNHGTGGGGSN